MNNQAVWELVKPYFNPKENWGNHSKINPVLLWILWEFRKSFPDGGFLNINCGYEERDTGGGHPEGRAVDFWVKGIDFEVIEEKLQQFLISLNLENWVALGVYPEWGGGKRPGFHLEIENERRDKPRRWGARYKENGNQEYIAYDLAMANYKRQTA